MKKLKLPTACLAVWTACQVANALPALQLDIKDGFYAPAPYETIVTASDTFTLYALADSARLPVGSADRYYLSVAVIPQLAPPGSNLGSFRYLIDVNENGEKDGGEDWTIVAVVDDMTYGVPPLEVGGSALSDPQDLEKHGIFETYFAEIEFSFGDKTTKAYNSQTSRSGVSTPGPDPDDATLRYVPFLFDVSGLSDPGTGLHFDLYDEVLRTSREKVDGEWVALTDVDADHSAPFSHDASTVRGTTITTFSTVPDGGATAALLGLGVLSLGFFARRKP